MILVGACAAVNGCDSFVKAVNLRGKERVSARGPIDRAEARSRATPRCG